jgi:type IV fimbrial biogenesis protein FimT
MLKNQSAFTLIELLVTICVLGVLLSLAVPSYKGQVLNSKATALAEDVTTRINQARYEAIKRAARVTICASSNSTSATPTCTGNWADGYIVFEDDATTDSAATVTVGTILKAYAKHDPSAAIEIKNDQTAVTFMRFTSVGTLARIANSVNPLTINTHVTGCKGDNHIGIC